MRSFRLCPISAGRITGRAFLLALGMIASAAPETPQLIFEQISVAQGLSQSIVTTIIQDRRGYLWFGTEDGLNLYDGYGFTVIRTDPADSTSLSYNQVTALYEDRDGVIWAGLFNGGLNRYLLEKNQFIRYRASHRDTSSLSHDLVYAIIQDHSGQLWVGTDWGLNRMNKHPSDGKKATFTRFFHDPARATSLSNDHVRALAVDSTGNLWIGSDQGISMIARAEAERENPQFTRMPAGNGNWNSLAHDTVRALLVDHTGALWIGAVHGLHRLEWGDGRNPHLTSFLHRREDPASLSNNHIWALLEDDAGSIWIGTDGGGINRYDPRSGRFAAWRNDPHKPHSLSHNEIRSLFQDRSGLLWVGTYGGGVSKVDARPKRFLHYACDPNRPEGLSQPIIWGLYEDPAGMLWIGTHGGGLDKLDRRTGRYSHYRAHPDHPDSLSHNIVRLVIPGQDGTLWIGTNGGGLCHFNPATGRFVRYLHEAGNPHSLVHNELRSLFLEDDSILWIGTNGGGLDRLDLRTLATKKPSFRHFRHNPADSATIASNYIRFVHKDRDGCFWIGTQGGGLDRYDQKSERFTHYRHIPGRTDGLSSNYTFCLYEDSLGIFWIGTWGAGLVKFDRHAGRFTSYSTKDGLPSDAIYGILPDEKGRLWFSTNNGITCFNPATGACKNYSMRDGLQSNEFNGGSYFKSSRGEMFFGGINGINAFFPEQIQDNPHIPPIVLTSFRKMNRLVRLDQPLSEVRHLTLSHRDYLFSFEFAALDYTAPEKNRYAYKMEGLDQEWITTSASQRVAQYTTLSPGRYIFRVKGSNNDGVWNEEGHSIAITITPPLWQSGWFRMLILLGIGGTIFFFYRRRLRLLRVEAELRAAHDMQMAIMPQADPQLPGYEISGICIPANQVGGDFFDYAWVGSGSGNFGIVIGDVSGKAMRAAMLAVMANGMVHAEAAEGRSPAEALTRSNRMLYSKMDRQTFIAICLVLLDLDQKSMRFTNAGLSEPLLCSGGKWRALHGLGSPYPIGVRENHEYDEQSVQLKPGDLLILQTDGLEDAMNHDREFYGEERLMRFLQGHNFAGRSAREIRDAILADVKSWTGGAHHYDDMTVIVVKVTEN